MSAAGDVVAVLVNYNGGAGLARCVASLRASDFGARPIVVVDNASRDGSGEALLRAEAARPASGARPVLELLVQPLNRGFAAGANLGLRRAAELGATELLLLNPDTEVERAFLAPLRAALADGAALAGPKLLLPGEPPRIWSAGGALTWGRNLALLTGHGEPDRGQHDTARDVSFLAGTCWLLRRDWFERLGAFDEAFFCYVEDVDFCARATRAGARLAYAPRSRVVHEGSAASGGGYTPLRKYLSARNAFHLLRKHGSAARWLRFLVGDVLTLPLALGYATLVGRPGAALWKARGLLDGWRGRAFDGARRAELLPRDAGAAR
ncbi:MAG: glycosyltransferase family 2 protein [Planctomycetes bacterium]|nr:glycosyltransferase family 2 protein [Planctomycetota bacterium]